MMECEDILVNNKTSICIHCCSPVHGSNNNNDNNNPFPHSSPSLSNSTYYVTKALSSIFKLHFLKPFDTLDWPQTNEQLSLLCIKCNDVLADLYHLYQDFLQLGQVDSFLSKKLDRLDEIIDGHERQSINCDLITITKIEECQNKEAARDDSPPISTSTTAIRKLCPKELSIVVTPLSANDFITRETTTTKVAAAEEFGDSPLEKDIDNDDDYNPGWLDVNIEDDDEFDTQEAEVKGLEEIVESEDDEEKSFQYPPKNFHDHGIKRRKQNVRFSSNTQSSLFFSTTRTSRTNSSKTKGNGESDPHNRSNNINNKDRLEAHRKARYLSIKQRFPNPCWYCKQTDFKTPTDCFDHTIAEHFPKTKHHKTKDTSTVCKRCSKICCNSNSLIDHRKWCEAVPSGVVFTNRRFHCSVCAKGFKRKEYLQVHMACHTDERPLSCDQCDFEAKTKETLRMHKYYHHQSSNNGFKCDECQREFKNPMLLTAHKTRMHTAEGYRKYKEKEKIKSIKKKEQRKAKAIGAPSSTVCVDCNVDLFTRPALINHRRTFHGDLMGRKFTCDTCGKTFGTKCKLDHHMRVVHSEARPFMCETCGKSFKTRCNLKCHLDHTHTEEGRLRYNEQTREKNRRRKLLANQLALKLGDGQLGQTGGESSNSNEYAFA